jgi:hypothetical protein
MFDSLKYWSGLNVTGASGVASGSGCGSIGGGVVLAQIGSVDGEFAVGAADGVLWHNSTPARGGCAEIESRHGNPQKTHPARDQWRSERPTPWPARSLDSGIAMSSLFDPN